MVTYLTRICNHGYLSYQDLQFTYEYRIPADLKYGGFNSTSLTWNGMIHDLLEGEMDAVLGLSVNTQVLIYS